jgi:hypothetical protein
MALLEINWKPGNRQLRQFAALWMLFFGLVGAYCMWVSGAQTAATILWLLALTGAPGLLFPGLLRPVYVVWMALALPIGYTISHILLLLIYYAVLTPIALVLRLLRYDPLQRRRNPAASSYWITRDPVSPPPRYFKQY